MSALYEHLATGITNTCRCWDLTRQDGVRFGFTDHDMDLSFDGRAYSASTGMSARALMQGTGLAVDNTEALGVLSDDAVSEADIRAGKFDGAEVQAWLVNWQDVSQRKLRFRGSIGELRQGAGAFHAELRGLTDALNQVQGRSYQYDCPAVLGDSGCRFALEQAGFTEELSVVDIIANRAVIFAGLELYEPQWVARGRLSVSSGAAAGLNGVIKNDMTGVGGNRRVDLWA
ncbi:MAG: DUF2163 domain-containing protein, partial [Rhodobacteraceae bacterium]|nr:DUF2163 domain-containing protein [Paracoccaceae bacterium]